MTSPPVGLRRLRAAPGRPAPPSPEREEGINWGLFMAVVVLVAPTLFSVESNLALPGPLRIHGAKAVEALAIGGLGLWMIRERWMPWLNLPMLLGTVFVGYSALSCLWAVDQVGFGEHYKKLIHVFAVTVAMFIAIRTRRDLEHAMLAFKMTSFAVAASTCLEVMLPAFRVAGAVTGSEARVVMGADIGVGSYYRANGPMGHPNWLGFWLGTTIVLTPALWVRYPSRNARVFIAIGTLLELYALVEAHVRLGLVGVAAGTMWLILRGAFGNRTIALGAIALGAIAAWPILPASWKARTFSSEHLENSDSIKARWSLIVEGIELGLRHGGIGCGWGSYGYVFYDEASGFAIEKYLAEQNMIWKQSEGRVDNIGAHNAYLELLVEVGLPGLLLFLATGLVGFLGLVGAGAVNARDPPARMMALVLEAAIVGIFTMNFVMHAQERREVWTWLGITAAYVSLTRYGLMREPGDPHIPSIAIWPVVIIGAVVGFLVLVASLV